jgi:hypothetical protein
MTSAYWQCGKCGALHVKDADRRRTAELWIQKGSPVLGSDSCASCGNRYEAEDVYRGNLDPPQHDAFIADVIADPAAARWNTLLKLWTLQRALAKDEVPVLALNPATVTHYRESASPLQLAAVAMAKTSTGAGDLETDNHGLVVPGVRLKSDFPSWRVWVSDAGALWVTKRKVAGVVVEPAATPAQLARACCAGPLPAIPYLVSLCMNAGLDPNKLSPLEIKLLDDSAAGVE